MAEPDAGYGFFGPNYSFAENIPLPGAVGVRRESSISAIIDSVGGINFYMDTIAFGGRTMFNKQDTRPMGIRYYLNTGQRCSNGATMSEYVDGVTKGDLLGNVVKKGLESAGLPGLRGLAPGMLESARDALDPRPIFAAITGTGYPVCQQVQCPVGDVFGRIRNQLDPDAKNYIIDPVQVGSDGLPTQTRWVQAYNSKGAALSLTKDEFAATPKCYNPDGTYKKNPDPGCAASEAARISVQGKGKFDLCRVVQNPALPASLSTQEAFAGSENELVVAVSLTVLGGIMLWLLLREAK